MLPPATLHEALFSVKMTKEYRKFKSQVKYKSNYGGDILFDTSIEIVDCFLSK
jgi:hypothetical protein